jgi:copper homeostasis protein
MARKFLIEAVVDSLDSAVAAERAGADRLELCSGLDLGGLTPGAGVVQHVRGAVRIPVHVLLRPRAGDFLYTDAEFETLLAEVEAVKAMGVEGIVVGMLLPNGRIDVPRMQELVRAAGSMNVTFHRAFDRIRDLAQGLEDLKQTGCNRVLCSGLAANALEGVANLNFLCKNAGADITIMPGGGIAAANVLTIAKRTGATEFHFSAIKTVSGKMSFHPAWAGGDPPKTWVPAPEKVLEIKQLLEQYFNENT